MPVGLLARDLDGNGVIDSGLEFFGDNTQLANGQTAAHGFAALAEVIEVIEVSRGMA